MNRSVIHALLAAALFGASTPFAKLLVGSLPPVLLAGLLYLGSGVGLAFVWVIRNGCRKPAGLARSDWPSLMAAIVVGGVLGPVALFFGLTSTSGSTASLLLNLEAVLTAAIAWVVFKENADRRIVSGMALIVAGAVVLSWPTEDVGATNVTGPFAVIAACLCWAVDNNLTRKVSAADALFIAGIKGLIAGMISTVIAFTLGAEVPDAATVLMTMSVGLLGYGISLVLFVLALRGLGTSRTGAYFSIAPFVGATVAIILLGESPPTAFWLAVGLMSGGIWLHLTEHHDHEHTHEAMQHAHQHAHDEHHQHSHDFDCDDDGLHHHEHTHFAVPVAHKHPHFPDIHHRHRH